MSSFCKVTCGKNAGGTQRNAAYILRDKACKSWETVNIDEYQKLGLTDKDIRKSVSESLGEYAEQGRGVRKDYRAVLSFKGIIDPEKAKELAREFVQKSHFKNCPSIIAVHTNTKNTHAHILAAARQLDGKKLDLSNDKYKSFDKVWARIHDRNLERGSEQEHLRKCNEKEAIKKAFAQGLTNEPLPRPRFTIQQWHIRERLQLLKEKVRDFAKGLGDRIKGIFKKPGLEPQEVKNFRRGDIYNENKWRDLVERSKAGLMPDKGKSPQAIRVDQVDRQNLGKRFSHDGEYHVLDGVKGFAINHSDYGKDLYLIPNKGEIMELVDRGKIEFDKVKEKLGTARNLNLNQYQFEQLQREGKFARSGEFVSCPETGREFHFEMSGSNINLVDRQEFENSLEKGRDLSLVPGRGR